MINEPKNLIIVYNEKDELALNLLKKLVETNDDKEQGVIIGTEDNSVKIIAHSEKVYLDNKKIGKVGKWDDRILFIDKIKGIENLVPTLDIKFDKFGVKYGFSGKQAVILTNVEELSNDEEKYTKFLEDLKKICTASTTNDKTKYIYNNKFIASQVLTGVCGVTSIFNLAVGVIGVSANRILSLLEKKDLKLIRKQQLLYAVTNLYLNDLDNFMKN